MFFNRKENAPQEQDLAEIKEAMERPMNEVEETPTAPRQQNDRAPMFVKVDKYKEILTSIHEIKLFVSGIRQLFTVLHEVESIRSDALNIMRANIQRVERSVAEMDSDLLRPRGVTTAEMGVADVESRHIEDTLTELQKQLAGLRKDLQGMKTQEGN